MCTYLFVYIHIHHYIITCPCASLWLCVYNIIILNILTITKYMIVSLYHRIITSYYHVMLWLWILPKSNRCLCKLKCYDLVFRFRLPDDSLPFFDSACESSGCSLDSLKGWLCLQLVPRDTFPKPIWLASMLHKAEEYRQFGKWIKSNNMQGNYMYLSIYIYIHG